MEGFEQEEKVLSDIIRSQGPIAKMYSYAYPESDHALMRKSMEIAIKVPLSINVLKCVSSLQSTRPIDMSILFSVLFTRTKYQKNLLGVGDPISSVKEMVDC